MMNIQTIKAFAYSIITANVVYVFSASLFQYMQSGSIGYINMWIVLFILIFSVVGCLVLAVPIHMLLVYFKLNTNLSYLVFGTLIGGFIVANINNGIYWQHPEGFITGLSAAFIFNHYRMKLDT